MEKYDAYADMVPELEEAYKHQILWAAAQKPAPDEDEFPGILNPLMRQSVWIHLPIPRALLPDMKEPIDVIMERLRALPWVEEVREYEKRTIEDRNGETIFDVDQHDVFILSVIGVPFRKLSLSGEAVS